MMNVEEMKDLIKRIKQQDQQNEFEELYEKYKKEVEYNSGGLIETNRADFLKQFAFYSVVIHPTLKKYFDALIGK